MGRFKEIMRNGKPRQRAFKARGPLGRPRTAYADDAKLKVIIDYNPHRPRTYAHQLFEVMRISPTLGEYRRRSVNIQAQPMIYLINALAQKYISLEI